ncbi:hypothetical protein MKW92_049349 [Papaver armeniacum]|nr:hypothetical protein MKW92_049349 [Papaver armeniacum]
MERGLENMKERVEEDEKEEEEEKICRICHSHGDSQNPFQYPCACSGSMKFVHPKCLLRWMAERISLQCEVCKHKYSVHRVYAENTPNRLPLREFVGGIAMKACHVLLFCVGFCFSVSQQLLLPPLIASWIWRLSLVRSLSEAKELVDSHMSASTAMMDWLYGFVISNVLFVMLLCGIILMREDEEDAEDGAYVAIAPTPGNENHIDDEIGEDEGEPQAIAGVRNDDNLAPGLRLLVILLVHPLLQSFQAVMIMIFRFNFLITNGVLILVPFSLGRIILHCLSWIFFAASSIFMPFIESALSIGNNSLKNASPAVTNFSAEIQKDGLLSCAIEVVTETLTANVIGPGEALSSVGKPLSVYRSSGLYDVITLATGYMVVVSLVFVCYPLASKIRYYLRKFQTMMIYPFFLIIHLIVLPLVYGWWLDVCTITMLGKSCSDRIEFLLKFPLLSSSMHWAAGIIYMSQIHISTCLLRRVLLKEVLYILQYLADPIDIILHGLISHVYLQASRLLFSVAINGISIVFLVYLPAILAMRLAPTIFPLRISVSDPFTEIPVVMLLLQICIPYATELWETIAALLHQWVTSVCCFLGLSTFLCSRPEDIGGQEIVKYLVFCTKLNLYLPLDLSTICSYTFVRHVVLFIILEGVTLLLLSSSLIIVSLPLGRVLFSSISDLPITHGIECNDLYAFFIGKFSIWTSFTGVRYLIEHFRAGKAHLRFSDLCKLFCIVAERCVLLSLWSIVIPVLIGLLFEFTFVLPIRALVPEVPVLLLCQDWAVGFFFFKLWRTVVFLNHRIVLVDESWRVKFERARENDFLKLPRHWVLQEFLIPIIMNLLMSLCLPYVFARWLVPSLGFSLIVNSTVYQFTWVAYLAIVVLFSCAKRFPVWITNLHNSMRNERYSGLGLQNFGEAALECQS